MRVKPGWTTGALCFVFNRLFYGWGHAVSHVVLGVFSHYLLLSAANVPGNLDEICGA